MASRIVFAVKPTIYHPTGLKLKDTEYPCPKLLIEELLKDLLYTYNPPGLHKCSSLCRQMAQVVIGYPHSEGVRGSVSEEFEEKLQFFEDAITNFMDDRECWFKEKLEVHSLVIRFLPCTRYLEVADAAIYLF